jgi:lipooligosaccharide transport system permease protein
MALATTPVGTPVPPLSNAVPDRVPFGRSALAAYEHMLLLYRRTWRGSIFGNFLTPVMFLVAMGVGLGSFVDQAGSDAIGGVPYLSFLAPGLLVSTVMQTGSFEATFPILGGFRWTGRYHAMHATPLTPDAIALGQIGWTATRITLVGTIFFVVMVLFGAVHSPWGVLAIPVATLTGLSFSGPIGAFMATQRNANIFSSIWRFLITPLFLFAGTFFPIENLPPVIQPVAWILPLWHGVDLARALTLGTVTDDPLKALFHVIFLVTFATVGLVLLVTMFRRQLRRLAR